ncbi:PQQ-binding-like beta-propeller repeat protein [Cyclobacterium roseum]|uniref:PQQ-binding-like beta-propeller repeat protein n=1 Tax=Cyclobacterium roseum TaxID=2666137 RepID=UPI0013919972|nr:PQQ-binding-like beta-propeller repeat protein [Cyclobacterium roseum]
MKISNPILAFVLIPMFFLSCVETSIDVPQVVDPEEEEPEIEEEEALLEDPEGLPFVVQWSVNKTEEEVGFSMEPFLHASEAGLYYASPLGPNSLVSLEKETGEPVWELPEGTVDSPFILKKIGNFLWGMYYDINNPSVVKLNPEDGSILLERPSGTFPSGQSDGTWFGLKKRETSLYQVNLETGNDVAVCGDFRVDNIRNFLFKDNRLTLMAIRGGRSLLNIDPNACTVFWEITEGDTGNFGHLNYYSFAVDLGSKILSVGPNYFMLRSPLTGQVETKFPAGDGTGFEITQFLYHEGKNIFLYHDNGSGKVFAYDWINGNQVWDSAVQSRDVGQLFLVKDRLFLYTISQKLFELDMENGQTLSETETKELFPFDRATISFSIDRVEEYFGQAYFKISGDEIYYTTAQSRLVSARLEE